jgi:hypothetical protein
LLGLVLRLVEVDDEEELTVPVLSNFPRRVHFLELQLVQSLCFFQHAHPGVSKHSCLQLQQDAGGPGGASIDICLFLFLFYN